MKAILNPYRPNLSPASERSLEEYHERRSNRFHKQLFPWLLALAAAVVLIAVKVLSET